MIFSENQSKTNIESVKSGINNYSVITDQLADNLHDLATISDKESKQIGNQVNQAENLVRKASIILAKLEEELSD
jgi:hypothetical protein